MLPKNLNKFYKITKENKPEKKETCLPRRHKIMCMRLKAEYCPLWKLEQYFHVSWTILN